MEREQKLMELEQQLMELVGNDMIETVEKVREFVAKFGSESDVMKVFREQIREAMRMEKGDGRKEQVRQLLEEHGRLSIKEMAELLQTSDKNISSQLSYLRKMGVKIATSCDGKKFIEG